MATSDFALLTVENTGGALALKRKNAAEVVPEAAGPVYGSVTGNPAVLTDAAGERVLRSVEVNIEPQQAGSGDPSPDNVRAISGWAGAKVTRCGKNLIPGTTYQTNANSVALGQDNFTDFEVFLKAGTYVLSVSGLVQGISLYKQGSQETSNTRIGTTPYATFTVNADDYFRFWAYNSSGASAQDITSVQLEFGSTPTDYEPYQGETYDITFPTEAGTVYGGTLDLTAGTLTVTHAMVEFGADTSRMTWSTSSGGVKNVKYLTRPAAASGVTEGVLSDQYARVVSSSTSTDKAVRQISGSVIIYDNDRFPDEETAFASLAANPVHVVYMLNNPLVYQLTPQQIAALAGVNTVWADCGPVSAEYVRDTGAAIDAGDADTRAMIGEASGTTASRSLAVGEYVTVGDKLYRVTSAVGAGETLVPGTNVTETTVGAELARIASLINA